jgi:tetratricopeptide (TPR) repeat protein
MRTLVMSLLGVAGLVLSISGANAAVTVLGPGPAEECFQFAENGGDLHEGLVRCSFALGTALSVSDRAATYVNRGVIHLGLRENDEAFKDIDAGIGLNPLLGDGYVDRGAALMSLGHYDQALVDLNKGISLGPHRPHIAYYDRAIIDERNGDIRAAYDDYKKALDIEPNFTLAADELKRFRVLHNQNGT